MQEVNRTRHRVIYLILAVCLIVFDQITKKIVLARLVGQPYVLIEGVFEFRYLENRGAAFGILQNSIPFFLVIAVVILIVVLWCFLRLPAGRHYLPLNIALLLLFSGAIGNMIDRIFRRFVVDFMYFRLIDFPIFNVADCYVTIGAALVIISVIFVYKDGDLACLRPGKGRKDAA
ncbi:MAG: signal peptidase II [Lachnospiraceae bacterium]|nr:signal peptidase II [Lachnospiraceae bacterium]MBR0402210.1 signal peptidase II [Lachnospiraceae bacterium]MBR2738936.1 signal peptidase II [Lachnospiraceae bacterium]MCR5538297.1 signal peptidase II [Lachnospiraceae bacterium]